MLVVVIATLRVYFVTGYDMPSALAVLAIVDRVQLLSSSVLTAMVVLVPLIAIQPATRRWLLAGNKDGAPFSTQMRTAILWIPFSMTLLATMSILFLGAWLVGWSIYTILHRRAAKRARKAGTRPPAKGAPVFDPDSNNWLLASVVGLMFVSVMLQPWLMREDVEMRSGDKVVGSVVGTQGDMTLLLGASPAGARWVQTDQIAARKVCRDRPEWYSGTLQSLLPHEGVSCDAILEKQRDTEGS